MLRESLHVVRPTLSYEKAVTRGRTCMGFKSEPESHAYPLAVVSRCTSPSFSKPSFLPV